MGNTEGARMMQQGLWMINGIFALTSAEVSALIAAAGILIGAITAFVKFGLGERGTLTITQAQGANTILDGALRALNNELVRKDEIIDEMTIEYTQLKDKLKACEEREQVRNSTYRIGDS